MNQDNRLEPIKPKINPLLQKERDAIDFNKRQLSELIWGGTEKFEKHLQTMKIFASDPSLRNTPDIYDYTRPELIENSYKRLHR